MPKNTTQDVKDIHERAKIVGNAMTSGCKAFFATMIAFFCLGIAVITIYFLLS